MMLNWDPPTTVKTPIRVFLSDGSWRVAYGSYADGFHATRDEAVAAAVIASGLEGRPLVVEQPST